jgi:diketogulonate reductase-like aldo/keto reductase
MSHPDTLRHPNIPLAYGPATMPAVGFGTLIPDAVKAKEAVRIALETGFRHLDCAERYGNEAVVGEAIAEAIAAGVLNRGDLFVTTKLWNNNHRPERVAPALEASLKRLRIEAADCYLVHTPFAFPAGEEQHPRDAQGHTIYDTSVTLEETWGAMEALVDSGKARCIGLSDITLPRLKEIVAIARIKPAVVQVEAHPYLPEWELLDYCRAEGILLLAFAPLGHGMEPRLTQDPVIEAIARETGKTPAQVALGWAAQRGTAFLTTSTSAAHIAENFAISRLPAEAMRAMRDGIATQIRFNGVVDTGVPGFIPRPA